MTRTCARCGADYSTEDKRRKFCGMECYRIHQREHPNAGTFLVGTQPWNRGLAGLHLSPGSEFKAGQAAHNHQPVGTVAVRRRTRDDGLRAWVKVAEPDQWKLRSVVVWESANGPLPAHRLVHHVDRDSLNDSPDNLMAMTRAEHLAEHRGEFSPRRTGT